jgi:hypothetical protein
MPSDEKQALIAAGRTDFAGRAAQAPESKRDCDPVQHFLTQTPINGIAFGLRFL